MEGGGDKTIVAVTGASGFIAGEIIKQLLEKGYHVRGTVRSLSNATKTKHLLEEYPGLELFEADLLTEGSFAKCFEGCKYVMHTASPFQLQVEDPQRDLVDPALKGTLNVLRCVKQAKTVRRVVLTSSCAAVASQALPPEGKVWTEDDWNTDSTLENAPYRLSKSLAERAAWDFVAKEQDDVPEEERFDLVVMNPSFVLGPPHSARVDSVSVASIKGFLDGSVTETPNSCFGAVDVRDVAKAHILGMEKPEASGRFILSSPQGISQLELAKMLAEDTSLSNYPIPTKEKAPVVHRPAYSNEKAKQVLGLEFTPIPKSLSDMAHALIRLGLVPGK
ncbi:Tetraketide alpha-pyrone reductase [Balamuthia mandrillaris]